MRKLTLTLFALVFASSYAQAQPRPIECRQIGRDDVRCGPTTVAEMNELLALPPAVDSLELALATVTAERDSLLALPPEVVVDSAFGYEVARAALTTHGELIRKSNTSDRSDHVELHGIYSYAATPDSLDRWDIYIFADAKGLESLIEAVDFYVDGGGPVHTESSVPYDLMGSTGGIPNAFNLFEVPNGEHQICASYRLKDGNGATSCTTFVVDIGGD